MFGVDNQFEDDPERRDIASPPSSPITWDSKAAKMVSYLSI